MEHIGEIIGTWKIISKLSEKHNDGHAIYEGECILCGFKNTMKLADFHKKKNYDCNHFTKSIDKWTYRQLHHIMVRMMRCCYDPNYKDYKYYGAKGIKVCDEWRYNHKSFDTWAMENGYQPGLSIDRIDSTKDYCPENCRWITIEENAKWKSTTNTITVNGITDTGRGFSRRLSLGTNHINRYLRKHGLEETQKYIEKLMTGV